MFSLEQLRQCLDTLQAGSGRRRRRNRRRRARRTPNAQPVPTPVAGPSQPLPQRRRRGRRARAPAAQTLSAGEVTLSRSERVVDISARPGSYVLHPSTFPWLSNLAKAFDMYRFVKAVVEYRPVVGAMSNGAAAVGFDWASKDTVQEEDGRFTLAAPPSRDAVLATTPCFDTPVWQGRLMPLPPKQLAQKQWYSTTTAASPEIPGSVVWAASALGQGVDLPGEIWVHYTVVLSGTRKV
uniref:Capsid protein n=1 Tax=Mafsystermes virus TaxID=2796611 RepID=A0A7T7GV12_9VIRU|nr:putative coat protein [Mafsystermes virus]